MDKNNNRCGSELTPEEFRVSSRSKRNCSPGNFKYVGQYKSIGKDRAGFAVFPSYEVGFEHLKTVLRNAATGKSKVYAPSMTLYQFFAKYAPTDDANDPKHYSEVVAKELGVPPTTLISNLV